MNNTNSRVAKNTVMLYTRQIIIMFVSLYTVRTVLRTLGETDYGLYTVVAGIVTVFTIFSGAMASASQRFFSFDLGKKDYEHLKKTFNMTLIIYGIIIAIAFIFMETVGLWYVINQLVIPDGRKEAVIWTYQASICSLVSTLFTTPYMALLIAHENMDIYATMSIVEAALKLAVSFVIQWVDGDKLIAYAVLTAISTVMVAVAYRIYCRYKYEETKMKFYWEKKMFKEIVSFTGWNMFGSAVGTFKIQAVNIILNQNFNQVVVTARGIAASVNSAVVSFSQSFGTAIRPVIIKEYANENYTKVNYLIGSAAKMTFFLMYIFILPLILEMEFVLKVWLGIVPEGAVLFTILTLIDALIDSVSYPLMTAAQATGKIRLYQAVVGGIQLMNLPVALIAILSGSPAYGVFIIAIILTIISFFARILILTKIMDFSGVEFIKKTVLPIMAAVLISVWIPYGITNIIKQSILRVVFTTIVSLVCNGIIFWSIVINKNEKAAVKDFINERRKAKK